MSYPRRPRSVLAQLLDAAKKRRGCDWPEVDTEAGLTKSTRESWLNGNVKDPGIRGVVRLAHALRITPDELVAAVLWDELPDWAQPPPLTGEAAERARDDLGRVLDEKAAGKQGRQGGRGRRPRSNGQPGA